MKTVKGVTREYRRARKVLKAPLQLTGAFHLTRNGLVVAPVDAQVDDLVVLGPVPGTKTETETETERPIVDVGDKGKQAVTTDAPIIPLPPDDLPPLPTPAVEQPAEFPPDDEPPPLPTPEVVAVAIPPPAFSQLEAAINRELRRRGFSECVRHFDCTGWPRESDFWGQFRGDVWCLAFSADGEISFGGDAQFVQAAVDWAFGAGASIDQFISLASNRPHFPAHTPQSLARFTRSNRKYLGIKVGRDLGIGEIRAWIGAFVDAFNTPKQSGLSSWGGSHSRQPARPALGILRKMTKPMPDSTKSPYHSFTLIANKINSIVERKNYTQKNETGSVSWKIGQGTVAIKWCFYGPWEWRFGVRKSVVATKARLRGDMFDHDFYVIPDQTAVFNGFLVFDTDESWEQIEEVLNGL